MSTQSETKLSLPNASTLEQAAKLAIKVSKPICFYFYIVFMLWLALRGQTIP